MGAVFDVVLFHPQIAPNTGNIMRLCANTGAHLHLVRPLGFVLNDRRLERAGLDYRDQAVVSIHDNWAEARARLGEKRMYAVDTEGRWRHTDAQFDPADVLLFGSEPDGLPPDIMSTVPAERRLRIPMLPDSRSMNLSNAVAVVVYEAWRQNGFGGGA